ncbi:MAG: septum formation initiator family protein [Syntrophorhabdaceae bacterium]|jgi:cell division protein FtsB|nr:septum formation initiator family protein [Syntrophorhabdaceae bacterium]MDD5243751.1 septum formation initiator family protein [Syntrophorhabdaceae bacterium]
MFEDAVVRRYSFIVLLGALLFQLVFAEGGVFGFIKMKSSIKSVRVSIQKTEKENAALLQELEKLQKDDQYLEEVARKKYGLVREGERLYRIER